LNAFSKVDFERQKRDLSNRLIFEAETSVGGR
jgi:hypothetical protein